jgi:hypothetical protein
MGMDAFAHLMQDSPIHDELLSNLNSKQFEANIIREGDKLQDKKGHFYCVWTKKSHVKQIKNRTARF